jgi:uncharacterized protein GlcG (DUF336 family)
MFSVEFPREEAARAFAEALANKRAAETGEPVTVTVTQEDGSPVYAAVVEPTRN